MSKKIVSIMIAVLLFISATACSKKTDTQNGYKANVVRVAQMRTSTYSMAIDLIMREKQLFEKSLPSDVTVEWSIISSLTDQRDALIAEQVDIGMPASSIFLAAVENGLPLVAICGSTPTKFHVYAKKSDPKTLKDLENLDQRYKISCSTSLGNSTHFSFMAACKDIFGNARRFDSYMVGMSIEDMLASVSTSDEIAVAITSHPFGQEAEVFELLEPILDLTPYAEEYSLSNIFTSSPKFYNENPILIEAYIQARKEAVAFVVNSPDEAAEILQKHWDTYSIEEIKALFLEMPLRIEISESGYDKLAAFMYELELIPNQPKKFSELSNYDSIPKIK